jgi:hypothetical protein
MEDGTFEHYKAWLVAKGYYRQKKKKIDFQKTFSLVVKPCTI